jgi:uncharacterized protein YqjF (DUF2071 family)
VLDADTILKHREHRPWPVPADPWVMEQGWYGLLFAHWPCPVQQVRALVPKELDLDTFDGEAWISLTPFRLRMRPRGIAAMGKIWTFPELNCRTYVTHRGRGGIYFFSLDAASHLAVMGARALYRLPYFLSTMEHHEKNGEVLFRSERRIRPAAFEARYSAISEAKHGKPGTLEHWLAERYRLYTVAAGKVLRADIHHEPWLMSQATVELTRNTVGGAAGLSLSEHPPLVQYSERQEVLIWPLLPA